MNKLPAAIISQRLRQGDRAAASIPELLGSRGQTRTDHDLREWHALIDLLMSGAVSPRKVKLRVDELYDPVKGDWSQVLRSPAIQECELTGMPHDLARAVCREKELLGDGKPGQTDWTTRLALSLADSSARKLVLRDFLSQQMFVTFSQAVRCNRKLQHLELCLGQVTDLTNLSSILRDNSTLHTLILRQCHPSVFEALAASLPHNTTLRHLTLRKGIDSTETGEEILFCKALGKNKGLREFRLEAEFGSMDSWRALAGALATNTTLVDVDLRWLPRLEFKILLEHGLLVNNNIVRLGIRTIEDEDDEFQQLLGRVMSEKPMSHLDLVVDNIPALPLRATLTMNSLVELQLLLPTEVGKPTVQALAHVLKRSASLRKLSVLSFNRINPGLLATIFEAIAVNQGLRKLEVNVGSSSGETGASLFPAIAKHPFLQELSVRRTGCLVQLAEMVKTHLSLNTISCEIQSVEQAQALIAAAKANRRLLNVGEPYRSQEELKPCLHMLHSYLDMNRHGRHKLLVEHPFLLADLMGSSIDFRTRINLVMENPEPLIQAIASRRLATMPFSTHVVESTEDPDCIL